MSVKSDRWIKRMAAEHGMISPFEASQVRTGVVSYGVSSYGYDIRVADEFKIFTNINSTLIDPKDFDPKSFVDLKADVCIVPPNSFALARTVKPSFSMRARMPPAFFEATASGLMMANVRSISEGSP